MTTVRRDPDISVPATAGNKPSNPVEQHSIGREIKIPGCLIDKHETTILPPITPPVGRFPNPAQEAKIKKGLGYLDLTYKTRPDSYVEIWDTDKDVLVGVLNKERLSAVIAALSDLEDYL